MQRRPLIFGATVAFGAAMAATSGLALGSTPQGMGLDSHTALFLTPDGRPLLLRRFVPAAGPLQRHASRPGAWYALLVLPMAPRWPVQLLLWSTERGHALRLFALDAAPDDAPSVVQALPIDTETSRIGRPPRLSSRFMLPTASTAPAVFVLVEQWRADGEPPAPLWAQCQAATTAPYERTPWWATRAPRPPHAAGDSEPLVAPPSPLTQQGRDSRVFELPIFNLPVTPESGVWR